MTDLCSQTSLLRVVPGLGIPKPWGLVGLRCCFLRLLSNSRVWAKVRCPEPGLLGGHTPHTLVPDFSHPPRGCLSAFHWLVYFQPHALALSLHIPALGQPLAGLHLSP